MRIETYNSSKNDEMPKEYIIGISDERKTTILKDVKNKGTKKEKTYYIYQTALFIPFLVAIVPPDATNGAIYLVKKSKNIFEIVHDKPIFDDYVQLKNGLPTREELEIHSDIESYVLPKRFIKYLQAYDKYQDVIQELNNNGKNYIIAPLFTELKLNYTINKESDALVKSNLYLNIYTKFTDYQFYKDIRELNNGSIPEWLDTILTDQDKKHIHNYFKTQFAKKLWKLKTVQAIDQDKKESSIDSKESEIT